MRKTEKGKGGAGNDRAKGAMKGRDGSERENPFPLPCSVSLDSHSCV